MVMKRYSVSLEDEIVEKAKENMKKYGGKLSPLLNEFLKRFNEDAVGSKKDGRRKRTN